MPIHGIKPLRAQLKDLRRTLGQPLLRRIARAGARLVRTEARRRVPVQSGRGSRGIVSEESRSRSSPGLAVAVVGFIRKPKERSAFYLRFIERGAKPHVISVVKERGRRTKVVYQDKRALRTKEGEWLGIAVFHRGLRPRPFLVPALQASQRAYQEHATKIVNAAMAGVVATGGLPAEGSDHD